MSFCLQDLFPELVGLGVKDQIQRGRMDQPVMARHFLLQLAGRPAGVTGEQTEFLRGGKGFAQIHQRVDGVAQIQIEPSRWRAEQKRSLCRKLRACGWTGPPR